MADLGLALDVLRARRGVLCVEQAQLAAVVAIVEAFFAPRTVDVAAFALVTRRRAVAAARRRGAAST